MEKRMPQPTSIRQLSAINWRAFQEQPTSIRQLYAINWRAFQEQPETVDWLSKYANFTIQGQTATA